MRFHRLSHPPIWWTGIHDIDLFPGCFYGLHVHVDSNRSDMSAFYEAPCHQGDLALSNRRPAARNDCLGTWSLFIKSVVFFERAATGGRVRTWLISVSQVDKSKDLVLNLLMKASDGTTAPQKRLNYFQLWQTIISAQLCCTSVKANKVAGRDWGSLLVSLSTPLHTKRCRRSKENICTSNIFHSYIFASICFTWSWLTSLKHQSIRLVAGMLHWKCFQEPNSPTHSHPTLCWISCDELVPLLII